MSFEEEFDRTIREKAEGAKFPFSEENWLKASQLIDEDRRSSIPIASNKQYWVFGIAATLLTGVVLTGYWLLQDKQNSGAQVTASTKISSTEKINGNINNQNTNIIANSLPSENKQINSVNNNLTSSIKPIEKENLDKTPIAKTGNNQEPPVSDNNNSTPAIHEDPSGNNIVSKGVIPNIERVEIKPTPPVEPNVNEVSASSATLKDESTIKIEALPALPLVFADANKEPELVRQDPALHKIWDEDYYKKDAPLTSHFVDAELGGMYLLGWQNQGTQDAKGLSGFAGINYGFYFNKKFALGTGIQLYSVRNINQPFYTNTQVEYGFGATQSQTVITCHSLFYAAIPFKLYYSVNQDYLIGLGVNAGYLVSANNTVETYTLSDNLKTATSAPQNVMGVYQGMNSVNMMLTGSVMKRLNTRWAVQAEFNYGLSDLFNASTNNSKQNSSGIRFGLNYRICSN